MKLTPNILAMIAHACHEANRAFCRNMNGDLSQPAWDDAPDWQRSSAEEGVRFLIENCTAGDSALHDNWSRDKVADGWVYGGVKDPVKKTHPCLVPFEDLPPEQQAKDRVFRAIVLGFQDVFEVYSVLSD